MENKTGFVCLFLFFANWQKLQISKKVSKRHYDYGLFIEITKTNKSNIIKAI